MMDGRRFSSNPMAAIRSQYRLISNLKPGAGLVPKLEFLSTFEAAGVPESE